MSHLRTSKPFVQIPFVRQGQCRRWMAAAVVCLTVGVLAGPPAWADEAKNAAASVRTSTYVFLPEQSSILQTGGIAGVNRTYTVAGSFQLSIDPNTFDATFLRIDANATDASEVPLTLDPNQVFNLTALTGMLTASGGYVFDGQTADGSQVWISLTFIGDCVHVRGETLPPPGTADFFTFTIDAVAQLKYGGGTGRFSDPYQIWTAEQMNAIGTDPNDWHKHFKLRADIDLSCFAATEFNLIGDGHDHPFTGVFDGDNRTISSFTCDRPAEEDVGLFRHVEVSSPYRGTIKNLGLVDPNVTAEEGSNVGSLVGRLGGTVLNCHVTGGHISGCQSVGGLVGYSEQGTIIDSQADTTVNGSIGIGGLVGSVYGGQTTLCRATGTVTGQETVGGLIGYNRGAAANCYAQASVTGVTMVGGAIGSNRWAFFPAIVANCYAAGPVTGNANTGGLIGSNTGMVTDSFWDTEASGQTASSGGEGKTTAQMRAAATFFDAGWDLVGETENGTEDLWLIFEGQDYPRHVLRREAPSPYGGGWGTPEDPYLVYTPEQMNTIGADPDNWGQCFRLMADIDLGQYQGTEFNIIGSQSDSFTGVFDGSGHAISNLTYSSTDSDLVGLFGCIRGGQVKNLRLIDPNVNVRAGYGIGALVGDLYTGIVSNCSVTNGAVSGGVDVGVLVGSSFGTVKNCSVSGHVTGDYHIGGLVGVSVGTIDNCSVSGHATGDRIVGGLVGLNGSRYARIPCAGTVTSCVSSGSVSARVAAGGLVGTNSFGTVAECHSTSIVRGDRQIGGLVARNDAVVTNCYSAGSVDGNECVGGLVGENQRGPVTACYSAAIVSATVGGGGLVGSDQSGALPVVLSFWDTQTSGQTTSAGGTRKTTAEMQTAGTFLEAGWDFVGETANGTDDLWWIDEGWDYPRLWWEAQEP